MTENEEPIQRFSFDPNPPVAGEYFTLCYDFAGPPKATSPVTVRIHITGGGGTTFDVVLDEVKQCHEFTMPSAAATMNIHDLSGQSDDVTVIVDD